jgi:hypothetical protein
MIICSISVDYAIDGILSRIEAVTVRSIKRV